MFIKLKQSKNKCRTFFASFASVFGAFWNMAELLKLLENCHAQSEFASQRNDGKKPIKGPKICLLLCFSK